MLSANTIQICPHNSLYMYNYTLINTHIIFYWPSTPHHEALTCPLGLGGSPGSVNLPSSLLFLVALSSPSNTSTITRVW